jgi:hypothetical protein
LALNYPYLSANVCLSGHGREAESIIKGDQGHFHNQLVARSDRRLESARMENEKEDDGKAMVKRW